MILANLHRFVKLCNATHALSPVADVMSLDTPINPVKQDTVSFFSSITSMSIVCFEQFKYFGCRGVFAKPGAQPSQTNPVVMDKPMPLVFVAAIKFGKLRFFLLIIGQFY